MDPQTFVATFTELTDIRYPIRFFTKGEEYRLLGLFRTRVRLYRVDRPAGIFLFGTDALGRDLLSRTLCGARISLSIGLVGVAISFALGVIFGGISGYFGGRADMLIQRMIEFIISIPTIPLWMGLAAALPKDWSVLQLYFGIVIILSLVRWGSLARVVRGKLLELREHDFTMAARVAGLRESAVIARHLLPSFASYLIVHLTLAIPDIILGETARRGGCPVSQQRRRHLHRPCGRGRGGTFAPRAGGGGRRFRRGRLAGPVRHQPRRVQR